MNDLQYQNTERLVNELASIIYRMKLLIKKNCRDSIVSPTEFCVMVFIKEQEKISNEPITISKLMEEMGSSLPAVSRQVRSLEQKGFIERKMNGKDRRVTNIFLTEAGEHYMKEMLKERNMRMEYIVNKMGEENVKDFLHQLQKLYQILEEMEEESK